MVIDEAVYTWTGGSAQPGEYAAAERAFGTTSSISAASSLAFLSVIYQWEGWQVGQVTWSQP